VVGRFLEHSRIYYFRNGGDEEIYAGSADLMTRNIDRRVEVLFPVTSPPLRRYLRDDVLGSYLADNAMGRAMLPGGGYERKRPPEDGEPVQVQRRFLESRGGVWRR
jgi:polyphosphate kinase